MEVKMKTAFLCCILLLAGSASCGPVEDNSVISPNITIPDWILDLIGNLEIPESIQNIIDRLPEIIAAIPDIIDRLPEIIEEIVATIPELIPIILDRLPEIIAQAPALIDTVHEFLYSVIDRIPEVIPIVLEKLPEIIEALPAIADRLREVYDRIKEILNELDLPDWFPTLPELGKPDWWPEEFPEIPDFNPATLGTPTTVSEYPSIVQIEVGAGPIWAQGFVATIVTNYHLLTPARCITGRLYDNRFRRARVGSSLRYEGGSVYEFGSVVVHPDYNPDTFGSDIGLIRLTNNLVLSPTVQQSPIVPQGFTLPSGTGVTVASWGSTAQGRLVADRSLYEINLSTVDRASCVERWRLIPVLTIGEDAICVADPLYGGRNGDIRDIGAPIYFQGILAGLVSFGAPATNQYFPVVATPIGSHTNWVADNAN